MKPLSKIIDRNEPWRESAEPQCSNMSPVGDFPYGCDRVACVLGRGHEGDHWSPWHREGWAS